jgi:hypothetical protein
VTATVVALDGLVAAVLTVSVVMAFRMSGFRSAGQHDPRSGRVAVCASLGACLSITAWLMHAPVLVATPVQLLSIALFVVTAVLLRRIATDATTHKEHEQD